MGSFLAHLKSAVSTHNNEKLQENPLINTSLAKIREYHGSFKSICDNFSISTTEYEQIFGNDDEDAFKIWDTNDDTLIDALELFSGLILFSDSKKFEEKIRFLFDLFDFNELNSLSLVDLQFLLLSCINATYKIYGEKVDAASEEEIAKFLDKYFNDESRINISQMLKWCMSLPEIKEYFSLIGKNNMETFNSQSTTINNVYKTIYEKSAFEKSNTNEISKKTEPNQNKLTTDLKNIGNVINSKKYQQKLDWVSSLAKKIFLPSGKKSTATKDVSVKINWVYGFRCHDVKKALEYIQPTKTTTEKIIYFTACLVIIYYPKVNLQKHYQEHEKEVISIAVGKYSNLIASGEFGESPAIHVWDSDSLKNIGIIKGTHQKGIHLMKFIHNDEFLVSCGIRINTPIFVHSLKNFTLLSSTYIQGLAIDLFPITSYLGEFKDTSYSGNVVRFPSHNRAKEEKVPTSDSFVVCSYEEIIKFEYVQGHLKMHTLNIIKNTNATIKSQIKCGTALYLNKDSPQMRAYAETDQVSLVIITGHKNGLVVLWEDLNFKTELCNYKYDILSIVNCEFGIIIATDSSTLHFWDMTLKNNYKNIDLTTFSFKLFNFSICDMIVTEEKLIVATTEGDLVEILLSNKQDWISNSLYHKLKAQRINFITKLSGNMRALSIIEKDEFDRVIFTAGESSQVYGFSLENHEIIDVWSVGENISAMDCINFEDGGTVFAVGCTNGKIFLRVDWEEFPKSFDCSKQINDIKFSSDTLYLIAASEDANVYIFMLNNNTYFQLPPKKIHFDNEIPLSITFTDENKSFLIGTSLRNQYKADLPLLPLKNLMQENELINCTIWNIRYPVHTKTYANLLLPLIIGGEIKVFIGTNEHGYVYFWKDREQLESNCGGFLKGHSSQISRIIMTRTQDLFFSLGAFDNTLIEWKVDYVEDHAEIRNEDKMPSGATTEQIFDEPLIRELNYSFFLNQISDKFKDNFVLFRGTNQKMINNLLSNFIMSFEESNYLMKRAPPLSLHLSYVYGFQCFDKRRTLCFVHSYQTKDQKKKELRMKKLMESIQNDRLAGGTKKVSTKSSAQGPAWVKNHKELSLLKSVEIGSSEYHQKETVIPTDLLLPLEANHNSCSRFFLYFTSRVAVIYNPTNNNQKFYEGHKFKITCMAVHPLMYIVATGEASVRPNIHVWNSNTTEAYKILKTFHKNGIIQLAFSYDGALLISLGMDKNFSIQVTNWKTEEIIALRNTGHNAIYDLIINPYQNDEFVTAGVKNVTIWSIGARNLQRKNIINLNENTVNGTPFVVTCLCYINFMISGKIHCDIVCGNNIGQIGIISEGEFILVLTDAHTSKMVNCIRRTEIQKDVIVLITSGEDECLKIWDMKFNKLHEINLRKQKYFEELNVSNNISVQSIDVYCCQDKDKRFEPRILLGTRNGDILEATITFDGNIRMKSKTNSSAQIRKAISSMSDKPADEEEQEDDLEMDEYGSTRFKSTKLTKKLAKGALSAQIIEKDKIEFLLNPYLRFHCSQVMNPQIQNNLNNKKVYIATHPTSQIMVTVAEDQHLFLWDTEKNKLLQTRYLPYIPTAIKFSPENGEILVIGFINGALHFLDSNISKNNKGNITDKFNLPSLKSLNEEDKEVIQNRPPVLNIEFSVKGEMLAVSFDNSRVSKNIDTKLEKEGSFISLYVNRASQKHSKMSQSDKNVYIKTVDIRCPSTYESYQTDNSIFGVAAYFMSFSDDENYLLIYYQLIDNNQVRLNNDPQGIYQIWDIKNTGQVKTWETIKSIQWKRLNFPNSLNAQYQFYQNNLANEEDIQKDNSSLRVPNMTSMLDLERYMCCGSANGDLHLVKMACLFSTQDFMIENFPKDRMCLGKSYTAHTSFINQVETHNYMELFTTGIYDECVMKWKLDDEEMHWDIDNITHELDQQDVFSEIITKDRFNGMVEVTLPLRNEIFDVMQGVDESSTPEYDIALINIIGRKAFNSRNNLYYDFDERVVYIAGCNVVISNFDAEELIDREAEEDEVTLPQEFIKVDSENLLTSSPEVSAIAISDDRRTLCAGTIQMNAKLLIWDICSKTCIKSLTLMNMVVISAIKWAYDNRHICCTAISSDYKQTVFLINTLSCQILGSTKFPYSVPFKIKDIDFFPNCIHKFVTCGIQNTSVWKYQGSSLTYNCLELEAPKELNAAKSGKNQPDEKMEQSQDEKQEESEDSDSEERIRGQLEIRLMLLCLTFVEDNLLTGADDGFIYIWDDKKIVQKMSAHPKAPVLCISASKHSPIFVSGGMDGRIILWRIAPMTEDNVAKITTFEKFFEYTITNEEVSQAILNPSNQIQSVCIGSKYILMGTKTGDIYELEIPDEQQIKDRTVKTMAELIHLRMSAHDNELTKSICFSSDSKRLMTITDKGQFSIWDIATLERLKVRYFRRKTINMIVCRLSQRIIIAFENEIVVLTNSEDLNFNKNYNLKYKSNITDMKLSLHEKILAVSLEKNAEQNSKIEIYDADNNENTFKLLCSVDNLSSKIDFLDFSQDNYYLLYKDNYEEVVIIDLTNLKKMNTIYVEFDIEWCDDGIRVSDKTKGIKSFYNEENKELKITKLAEKTMVVTDEMGTIRIFNYPCEEKGVGYMRCYSDHLNYINNSVLSNDKKHLVTSSDLDRSILIWRVIKKGAYVTLEDV